METLTDEQLQTVLMVGYGYHREWDYHNEQSHWVKGWLPGAPTNPLNDTVLEVCEGCGGDGGFDDTYIGRDHEVHSDWYDCNLCGRTGLMLIEAEPIEMADLD